MISTHLALLQVLFPLLAAPLCFLLRKESLAWGIAIAASFGSVLVCIALMYRTVDGGLLDYTLGYWRIPYGIVYRIDRFAAFVSLIVSFAATVSLLSAKLSITQEITPLKRPMFYALYLLCLSGMLGMIATQDIFNFYVFLEIASLSSYALIALGKERRALSASFQYLVFGTVGATFLLLGIGLLYAMTGTLNMIDVAARLTGEEKSLPVLASFALILLGLGIKTALFPLHIWLPNAYAYAPHSVSAFLASTATKVGIYALIRLIYTIFGAKLAFHILPIEHLLLLLGCSAVILGSMVALYQQNAKKLLAWSSIAQIGYLAIGIGLGTAAGLQASLVHLANHALAKGGLFLALAAIAYRLHQQGIEVVRMHDLNGLARAMPYSCAALLLCGLALAGMPLSSGFISKWTLASASISAGYWPLVIVILFGSAFAFLYIGRLAHALYFRAPQEARPALKEAPLLLLIPAWIMAVASWYTGIDTRVTLGAAGAAAEQLSNPEPTSNSLAVNRVSPSYSKPEALP